MDTVIKVVFTNWCTIELS